MINSMLPKVNGMIPNYSLINVNAAAGLVLNPSFTRTLCSYPYEYALSHTDSILVHSHTLRCSTMCSTLDWQWRYRRSHVRSCGGEQVLRPWMLCI